MSTLVGIPVRSQGSAQAAAFLFPICSKRADMSVLLYSALTAEYNSRNVQDCRQTMHVILDLSMAKEE